MHVDHITNYRAPVYQDVTICILKIINMMALTVLLTTVAYKWQSVLMILLTLKIKDKPHHTKNVKSKSPGMYVRWQDGTSYPLWEDAPSSHRSDHCKGKHRSPGSWSTWKARLHLGPCRCVHSSLSRKKYLKYKLIVREHWAKLNSYVWVRFAIPVFSSKFLLLMMMHFPTRRWLILYWNVGETIL